MNERNRYRLTGTLFLLALAVIGLPMVFDGAGTALSEPTPMPEPIQIPALPNYEEMVPATDVVERVQELQAEVDDEGFSTQGGHLFGEPLLRRPTAQTQVWAVQVGSFAREENARKQRQDLRAAGYEAFISTLREDTDKRLYRVAVGPLLSQADAQAVQRTIGSTFKLQPTLMEMSQ